MLLGVAAYFLVACIALGLAFLPPARAWAYGCAQRWLAGGAVAVRRASAAGRAQVAIGGGAVAGVAHGTRVWVAARLGGIGLAVAVLAMPPLLALALRGWQRVDADEPGAARVRNEAVAALLAGEQLVPPPTLPPEFFSTREVEEARPLTRDASREWRLLDDDFRQRLLLVFRLMRERHGVEMVLLEGYRSPQRQAQLAALGSRVTQAGPYQSYHQHGLAADIAFRRGDKVVISEADPWAMQAYGRVGELALSVGLVWGGGWTMKDYGHLELRRPGALQGGPAPAVARSL